MQRTAPHGAPSSFLLYPRQAAQLRPYTGDQHRGIQSDGHAVEALGQPCTGGRTVPGKYQAGFARLAAGLLYPRQGRLEALLLKGPRQPHRDRQLEGTIKSRPHPPSLRYSQYRQRLCRLTLGGHQRLTVEVRLVSSTPAGVSVPQPSFRDGQNPLCPTGAYLA